MLHLRRHWSALDVRKYATATPNFRKISRLLIANRGEIALRVIKTARQMGIETVAVYSDADRFSMHSSAADFAYNIGPPPSLQSYLNMDRIIDVAIRANAQAVHPGYGFLSENAAFATRCAEAGLTFVGPPPQAIMDMGAKDVAKQMMIDSNVPVILGYHGSDQRAERLKEEAAKIGYPVMLKAVYGGGGKGMRIAWTRNEFMERLDSARSEASKAFGKEKTAMIVEKFIERPRHVEVQVFGDHHGNYVYLGERDCSIQRRHQKIIEEAPAPGVDSATRRKLGEAAVKACKAVQYVGAGTVEFIMDPKKDFYFMEMNTRLQVEHPVTEAITGLDLVEWQIRVAEGEELPLRQEEISLKGHAIETRVYAEDTNAGFIPIAGKLEHLSFPLSARVDTGVRQGDEVSPFYDPMIAKIVEWDEDRSKAIKRLQKALSSTHIAGLSTNVSFARKVVDHPEFQKGNVYTDFIADHKDLFKADEPSRRDLCDAIVARQILSCPPIKVAADPFQQNDDFRINHHETKTIKLNERSYEAQVLSCNSFCVNIDNVSTNIEVEDIERSGSEVVFTSVVDGERRKTKAVVVNGKMSVFGEAQYEYSLPTMQRQSETETAATADACAPMPGMIEKILVNKGDCVKKDQSLVVMVAMKMEYIIRAPYDATVESLLCAVGDRVQKNTHLVKFAKE